MTSLPLFSDSTPDCQGCGVCCFHMGYPAFILPKDSLTEDEIESDPELRQMAKDPRTREMLLAGEPGEPHWHRLPAQLRNELEDFVENYQNVEGQLDPPCFWLDLKTRRCKHHEYRPRVCRDFEIGSRGCLEWRSHYKDRIQQL